MKRIIVVIFLSFNVFFSIVHAQTNCTVALINAREAYSEGRISELEILLVDCLDSENGFSKSEKIEVLKLLTLVGIYYNDREKAEKYLKLFLEENPTYRPNTSTEPAEFLIMYNRFRISPIVYYGFSIGFSKQFLSTQKEYSLDPYSSKNKTSGGLWGRQMGVRFMFPIKNFGSFSFTPSLIRTSHKVQEQVLRFASISLLEKQDWLSIPFQSNLYFGHRNCRPYFCVGGSIGFLLKASLVIEREDQAEAFSFSVAEDKVNVTEMRRNILFQPSLGIGIQFLNSKKRSNSYAELRFQYSSTNRTRPSSRYTNDELVYRFLYIDDDFKMSSIEVSIGYLIPYFKPVLKRSFRKG